VPSVLAAGRRSGEAAPAAVVLALHGWGQEAPEFAAEWAGVAERGIAVVAPESTQEPTPGFFVWDDRDAALGTIAAQYETASERLAAQGAPLVVAGFSQGGGLAVDLAIDGAPAPSLGFFAVASGLEDLASPPSADRLRRAAGRGLRGRLVIGAADEALEGARDLATAAAAAGMDCPLTVLPGAGHRMPDPGSGLLLAEVEALLT
jgi:predicted esterase